MVYKVNERPSVRFAGFAKSLMDLTFLGSAAFPSAERMYPQKGIKGVARVIFSAFRVIPCFLHL